MYTNSANFSGAVKILLCICKRLSQILDKFYIIFKNSQKLREGSQYIKANSIASSKIFTQSQNRKKTAISLYVWTQ